MCWDAQKNKAIFYVTYMYIIYASLTILALEKKYTSPLTENQKEKILSFSMFSSHKNR